MESKINVAELLKDCPQGMELDCVMYDDVVLHEVHLDKAFPIVFLRTTNGDIFLTTKYGQYQNTVDGKCIVFPKGKTSWNGFVPPCKFKDGDVLAGGSCVFIFKKLHTNGFPKCHCHYDLTLEEFKVDKNSYMSCGSDIYFATKEQQDILFSKMKDAGYRWNAETKMLEKLALNFKDGDVVATELGNWIAITEGGTPEEGIPTYCVIKSNGKFEVYIEEKERWAFDRLATEEEKEKLFNAIKENGYHWNAETKTLEKLNVPKFKIGNRITNGKASIKIGYIDDNYYYEIGRNIASRISITEQEEWRLDKFDITTLKPFDSRVLVRESKTDVWQPSFYGFFNQKNKRFYTSSTTWRMCIPYNEDTKHLIGSTNDCDNYFKTWEE